MSQANVFGAWARQRRKALDLTQQELAERVACAAITIAKIERGTLRSSQQLAELLAAALSVPYAKRPEFLRLARGAVPQAGPGERETGPPTNLPASLAPLVGRDELVAQAVAYVPVLALAE